MLLAFQDVDIRIAFVQEGRQIRVPAQREEPSRRRALEAKQTVDQRADVTEPEPPPGAQASAHPPWQHELRPVHCTSPDLNACVGIRHPGRCTLVARSAPLAASLSQSSLFLGWSEAMLLGSATKPLGRLPGVR